MKTLWTFGDSFTEGFNPIDEWAKKYIEHKGYIPKVYGEIISDRLHLNLKNLGKGGSDNYSILENICKSINNIDENDVIIIGWTSPIRFRLVSADSLKWYSIIPNFDNNTKNAFNGLICENTLSEIMVNRTLDHYVHEVINWIELLNKTFQYNTIIHWSHTIKNTKIYDFGRCDTISIETNGKLNDGHFSEKGQLQLSDALTSIINNKIKQKLI